MKAKTWYKLKRILAVILTIVIATGTIPSFSYATSTLDKLNQEQQEKKELEGNLDQTEKELEGLKGEHANVSGILKALNSELTKVSERLSKLESTIATTEQNIIDTQLALEEAIATKELQYERMKERIRYNYENKEEESLTYIKMFLKATSFSDFLTSTENFKKIADYDNRMLEEYKVAQTNIETQEAELLSYKNELEGQKAEAEAEKNKVMTLVNDASQKISHYANQIDDEEKKALEIEAAMAEKDRNIESLKEQYAKELAMSQQAANAKWRDISEVTFAEGDRHLLANLIYCEAGGESYAGQLAVGAVVINRVLSSIYPDSVVGVIYQNKQFSPVGSGRLDLALASNKATASCYRAADEAMSGITNVGGCVYFRTPVEGLSGISIGGHIFY